MKLRKLGNLDLNVSAVGLGCMSFAGFYDPTTKEESFKCLDEARNVGINFLDTAEMYGWGLSEEIIGEYQSLNKYEFHVATKGGIVRGAARGVNDNSETGLRKSLEGSLKRLRVDYIPLYYIHRRDYTFDIEDVSGTLKKFIDDALSKKIIAIDTETNSLNYMEAELVGISLAVNEGEAAYIPLAHDYVNAPNQLDRDEVLNLMKPLLENSEIKKIGHHLKFDAHIFARYKIYCNQIRMALF